MDVAAFQPIAADHVFAFPVSESACQVHLLRDGADRWSLLAFRSEPPDEEFARNFVDVHAVEFTPFSVSPALATVEILLHPRVSFASTGTHYVERSGRLLISSSYRWAQDEGPGAASYVSRVDECAS
jgi:hypothetical protein